VELGNWSYYRLGNLFGCRWVFSIKVGLDGTINRLKACLVTKGYTQTFRLDYGDTFSPVAKMASVHLFIVVAALQQFPIYQLDVKSSFLNGDLIEEIYMEKHLGLIA